MKDNELFELCKEVYKRFPGWKNTEVWLGRGDPSNIKRNSYGVSFEDDDIPLYTSDYLLEKLPAYKTQLPDYEERLTLVKEAQKYNASYGYLYRVEADTPRKALLKLVIALSDAGELK